MSTISFDTHAYIKKLKAVGVPEEQAEVQVQAIADLVTDRLVTKDDLERGLKELEYRLVIRLGGDDRRRYRGHCHAGEIALSPLELSSLPRRSGHLPRFALPTFDKRGRNSF